MRKNETRASRRRFIRQASTLAAATLGGQALGKAHGIDKSIKTALNGSGLTNGQPAATPPASERPVVGYMVYGRDNLNITDQLAVLRDSGFEGAGFHSGSTIAPQRGFDPFTASQSDLNRLRQVVASFKRVEVHAISYDWDMSFVTPNPAIRRVCLEELERHIDFAAEIGASVITAHPGLTSVPISIDEQLAHLQESMQRIAEMAEARKFQVCVETADLLINTANVRVFANVPSPHLGITMDTGHILFRHAGKEPGVAYYHSIQGFIEAWGSRIKNVHVNDYNTQRDHIGIGHGELPLKDILTALHHVGYVGLLDMEVDPGMAPPTDMPAERDLIDKILNEVWTEA